MTRLRLEARSVLKHSLTRDLSLVHLANVCMFISENACKMARPNYRSREANAEYCNQK